MWPGEGLDRCCSQGRGGGSIHRTGMDAHTHWGIAGVGSK